MDAQQEAWAEYAEACHLADAERYEIVEVWAWDRLQARLHELNQAQIEKSR